ncbi:MAG: type VI secretion system baseplate subunit TssK [Pseudomonadota bacterium]
MSIHQLAPVHWQMGQTLLPDHLLAQEDALTGEARLRYQAQGLPGYGVARLEWDRYLLAQGTFNIESLRIFTRDKNLLVDYPGNSLLISSPLAFVQSLRAPVYYFVLQENIIQNINANMHSSLASIPAGDVALLPKRLFKLILAQQPSLPEQYEKLIGSHTLIDQGKLAEFEQAVNKQWQLSERYIPPLIQIGTSEFLQRPLRQLSALLSRYLTETYKVCQRQQLSDMRHFEMKLCASTISQSLQYLANHIGNEKIGGEVCLHPYFLYEQLQKLNRELALLSGEWAALNLKNYRHNDLHGIFKLLFRNIIANLKHHSRNNQSFTMHLKDGCYRAQLPNSLHQDDKLYLIINCDQQPSLPDNALPCLSSPDRIANLYHYALSGAALKPVKHSAMTHYFGEKTQCFQLMNGEELMHIKRDHSIAFLAQPEFANYNFYVFYQPVSPQKTRGHDGASR